MLEEIFAGKSITASHVRVLMEALSPSRTNLFRWKPKKDGWLCKLDHLYDPPNFTDRLWKNFILFRAASLEGHWPTVEAFDTCSRYAGVHEALQTESMMEARHDRKHRFGDVRAAISYLEHLKGLGPRPEVASEVHQLLDDLKKEAEEEMAGRRQAIEELLHNGVLEENPWTPYLVRIKPGLMRQVREFVFKHRKLYLGEQENR